MKLNPVNYRMLDHFILVKILLVIFERNFKVSPKRFNFYLNEWNAFKQLPHSKRWHLLGKRNEKTDSFCKHENQVCLYQWSYYGKYLYYC
jgi:hypothetical protein